MEEVEIWKDIPEYEGLYQVSNMGQVKSLNYRRSGKEKILKTRKDTGGYMFVCLCKNNKGKNFSIHKLVALAFIPNDNPTEKTEINHLDENKQNNNVSNLCWCSHIENINYGTHNERVSKKLKGKPKSEEHKQKLRKPKSEEFKKKLSIINKGNLKGENNPMYGKHHTEEAKQKISETRKGKFKGENHPFYGKHHTEENKQKMSVAKKGKPNYKHRKPIQQYTKDMVFIRDWDSAKTAGTELKICSGDITAVCKGKHKSAGGFLWRYK